MTPSDPTRTATHAPDDVTADGDATGTRAFDGAPESAPIAEIASPPGYAVLREIARGGMGRVLAARDLTLDREVAIKILLPGRVASAAAESRFVRESRITARLPHPGIPPVHALGRFADGRPFLAMKLIQGRTLAEELESRANPGSDLPRFLLVFEQVCQAVGFAHAQRILHRDLKPANIMVGAFGEVQVMDWGLAKELDETTDSLGDRFDVVGSGLTQSGAVLGTPAYMAPEQARGEIARLDTRTDVFALGAILGEALTGARPYSARSAVDTLKQAIAGDLRPAFAKLDACGADADLIALAKRCLDPNPDMRPSDAAAVAGLMAEHRAGVEARLRKAEADRVAAATEAREQRKRRRVQLALAGAVLLLLGGVGVFAWYADREATNKLNEERVRAGTEREREAQNAVAVEAMLDRVVAALKADDAAGAALPLAEAERRVPSGGHNRLARCRRDFDMLVRLDRIDDLRWDVRDGVSVNTIFNGDPDPPFIGARPAIEALDEAFAKYGLNLRGDPQVGKARIDDSPIRDRLLAGIEWIFVYGAKADRPARRNLLDTIDPDSFRGSVRDAWLRQDIERFKALFEGDDAGRQPVRFAVTYAQRGEIRRDRVWFMLNACGQSQPRNFLLLVYAGSFSTYYTGLAAESISWFRAAIAVRPENGSAWMGLGNALALRDDRNGAILCFENAIRFGVRQPAAHRSLGDQLLLRGEHDRAIAEFERAVKLDDRSTTYRKAMAEALLKIGRRADAIREYRVVLQRSQTDASSLFPAGWGLLQAGDNDGAIEAFRRLTQLTPNDPWVHANLGIASLNKRDFATAAECYREAVRLEPKSAKFRAEQGMILLAKGDVEDAIAAYEAALRIDANHEPAKMGLARARRLKKP